MKKKLFIGIDPGQQTGVAWMANGEIERLETTDFWGAINTIRLFPEVTFVVEVPFTKHIFRGRPGASDNHKRSIGFDVGRCYAYAELTVAYLSLMGIAYMQVGPLPKKVSHEEFCELTGWTKRTNQHVRDAAMLLIKHAKGV